MHTGHSATVAVTAVQLHHNRLGYGTLAQIVDTVINVCHVSPSASANCHLTPKVSVQTRINHAQVSVISSKDKTSMLCC